MIAIKVPHLGESIVEGTIARWMKNEGDAVTKGEALLELETDKVNVEVPAPASGTLTKQLKKDGDVVKVGESLGEVDDAAVPATAGAKTQAPEAKAEDSTSTAGAPAAKTASRTAGTEPARAKAEESSARTQAAGEAKTSPAVRRIAAEQNIDVAQVAGSGRGGRVTRADIINSGEQGRDEGAVRSPAEATAAAPPRPATDRQPQRPPAAEPSRDGNRETREKMSTRRKRIAEHLLEAQQSTAHLTTFNEVDMSAVMQLRERLKERIEKEQGVKLTYMPFFARAACIALRAYPTVNAQIDGDSIVYRHYVNLGVAVASDQGLVVPVIKDADQKGMLDVSREITAVAKRARESKLTMDDLTGGTFTITNGGVFGSLVSTPILNYPQAAILGLHKIQDRPVVVDGAVVIRPMMYLALSYDHRLVEGHHAVLFLVRLKELMEDPAAMLVE